VKRIPFARLTLCLLLIGVTSADAERLPNVVLIVADDMGYGELGSYGQQKIQTPNLDQMAQEGTRFTEFYSGASTCRPARCTLMTGLHTGHCTSRINSIAVPLEPSDLTVAEVLKKAGYATAIVGKWGLGDEGTTGVPNAQGFDYFYGYLDQIHAHNGYPEFLLRNKERIPLRNVVPEPGPTGGGFATAQVDFANDLFTVEALKLIEEYRDRAFFLFLSYTIPHINSEARKQGHPAIEVPDLGQYAELDWPEKEKRYAAAISRLDDYVGQVLRALADQGIGDETIVLFSSDNGPSKKGHSTEFMDSTGSLRGLKQDLHEGGLRVPLIVRWPDHVPAAEATEHLSYFPDILPTLADLAGVTLDAEIDGISFLPTLLGNAADQSQHDYLYWEEYARRGVWAVRSGRWKTVKYAWREIELYDLDADVGEQKNVAAENLGVVSRHRALMKAAHTPRPPLETLQTYSYLYFIYIVYTVFALACALGVGVVYWLWKRSRASH